MSGFGFLVGIGILVGVVVFLYHIIALLSGNAVLSPGGKIVTKGYLKRAERLRQEAREEVQREKNHPAPSQLPANLTAREAALVRQFVDELRRNPDRTHAAQTEGRTEPRRQSSPPRRSPPPFQALQGGAGRPSGNPRNHRTVQ